MRDLAAAGMTSNLEYLRVTSHRVANLAHIPSGLLVIVAFLSSLIVFLFWRRTRYFGNNAPGLVALLLPWWPGRFSGASSTLWALPFAFVFVGGIYSDLLEPAFAGGRFYRLIAASAWILLGASAALSLSLVLQT